jgi:prevent-host-death family protein
MSANTARKIDAGTGTPDQAARRPRHLRAVPDADFKAAVVEAAEETGEPAEALFSFLFGALTASLTEYELALIPPDEADLAEVRQMLRVGEVLQGRIRQYMADLKASVPVEASSTEVRKNWADYIDRVRTSDETVYITQHGKRVAALVPPYVAESYDNDQAWFHTPEWQAKEREVDEARAQGEKGVFFASDADFLAALETENTE